MPVIVFASSKGGVGKSTSALCFAQILCSEGLTVTLLDADPNTPIINWAGQANLENSNLNIVGPLDENTICEAIEHARITSEIVIVDLEGSANLAVSYAIIEADLVLIPLQGSQLDADEAAKIIRMISRAGRQMRRDINFSAFFTRSSYVKSRTNNYIMTQLKESDIPTISTEIYERDAFKAVFTYGCFLHELSNEQVSSPEKAINNMVDFANETLGLLSHFKGASNGT